MNICLVGNGPSALKRPTGKFIDSCEIVIRMGNCVIDGHTEYVGSKTTIYTGRWKKLENNLSLCEKSDQVWILYPKPPHNWNATHLGDDSVTRDDLSIKRMNISRDKVIYVPEYIQDKYKSIYNRSILPKQSDVKCGFNIPATGTVALDMALNIYSDHNIYITGFDGYFDSTTYYFNQNRIIGKDFFCANDTLTQCVELAKNIIYNNITVI